MSSTLTRGLALAAALTSLALPAAAVAKGGGGGGGGGTTTPPPTSPAPCVTTVALNSGQIDKPASKKPISLDFKLTNCGRSTVSTATTLIGTSSSLRSV